MPTYRETSEELLTNESSVSESPTREHPDSPLWFDRVGAQSIDSFLNLRTSVKAKRGIVDLLILSLVNEKPMHGYQIMQEIETRSKGMLHTGSGSVYPSLQRLEKKGQVEYEEQNGKKVYHVTEAGKAAALDLPDLNADCFMEHGPKLFENPKFVALAKEMHKVSLQFMQIVHSPDTNDETFDQLIQLVKNFRKELLELQFAD
ncbi:MAG: PadR family transcriptional regulator [Bifidobacteriaceae bacterium]|jgi:DNA-binding PadR family transcriptional regulator|nr:PadR family transcriptional regulator [Bifidobacteriaceae bacterium]